MKLSIDNDPGFDVVLRTEDDRVAVKIPIRKGGFETDAAALLAAARFRASEEMYQALRTIVAAMDENREMNQRAYPGAIVGEPEWVAQARAALALADNTNETQK